MINHPFHPAGGADFSVVPLQGSGDPDQAFTPRNERDNLLINLVDRNPNGCELFLVGQSIPIVSLNCCHLLTVSKHAAQSRLHLTRRSQC